MELFDLLNIYYEINLIQWHVIALKLTWDLCCHANQKTAKAYFTSKAVTAF